MIVGFDVSQIAPGKAGGGYFAEGLLNGLAEIDQRNEYVLYPTFGDGVWEPARPRFSPLIQQANMRRGTGHRTRADLETFWRMPHLDETCLGNPDVVHSNNFYCPAGLRRARLVYTLYDLSFVEHPEWTTESNRVTCFTGVFNASLFADRILAISEYSRQHFLSTFPHYPSQHISVVYPASRFSAAMRYPRPRRLSDLEPDGFWLSVATLEPRKNHRRLLNAYAKLKAVRPDTPALVLVGRKGWLMENFDRELERYDLRGSVRVLGYVDDATLGWLYANCFAFLYVSLFEGFGMPALEAMTCGAAVIASNTTSLPEVVGNSGLTVDPLDEDAIGQAMLQLCDADQRLDLKRAAPLAASRFSWREAASAVRAAYEELGGIRRPPA
jgi:glycosyltransferase involved in cell wall biosynthesis